MDTQSSILAWRIPWTEEPGGLQTFEGLLPVLLQSPLAILHSTQPHMPTEHTLVTPPRWKVIFRPVVPITSTFFLAVNGTIRETDSKQINT